MNAIVSILPSKASRHNSPSQPHALTKTVNQLKMKEAVESAFIVSQSNLTILISHTQIDYKEKNDHILDSIVGCTCDI